MLVRNYTVYEGSKDPAKGAMHKLPGTFTKREANQLADRIRKDGQKRAAVYNGAIPRSCY